MLTVGAGEALDRRYCRCGSELPAKPQVIALGSSLAASRPRQIVDLQRILAFPSNSVPDQPLPPGRDVLPFLIVSAREAEREGVLGEVSTVMLDLVVAALLIKSAYALNFSTKPPDGPGRNDGHPWSRAAVG